VPTDPQDPFPPGAFDREDDAPDPQFYHDPRLVTHIDEGAIAAVGEVYARWIPVGARILDLMSSWVSHLPARVRADRREVVGHGLNAAELQANPALDRWWVQDLNADPHLPFPDATFDAVLCAVSVQYLAAPVAVFREVARVLRPGGPFIVTFSNRMFPTKAVRIWRTRDDAGHLALVRTYFALAGGYDPPTEERHVRPNPPGWREWFSAHDPLYAVIGRKEAAIPPDES
jgi:SAM-dependent methyltransferase